MILYHYSRPEPWPLILASGHLKPCWPKEGDWPKTMHLTDQPDRLPTGFGEGRTLRFTVDIDAEPWTTWGRCHVPPNAWTSLGIRHEYLAPGTPALSEWNQDADHWYVTTEPVHAASWIEVRLLDEDRILWP